MVAEVLAGHDYLDMSAPRANVTGVGAVRFVNEHLAEVARLWDGPAKLTGRHVVLALALEPAVGGLLLTSGDVASLLAGWQIEEHDDAGPLLVWDLLSVAGRDLADEQPLLAAALGAPAEWTVRLSGKVTHLVWAPLGERLAFCTASDVYEVTRGSAPRRIGTVEGEVLSVGWGTRGVVALRRRDGAVELTRVADGRLVGGAAQADAGVLSRDGAVAWFSRSDALERRTMSVSAGEPVPGSGRPLAIDAAGRLGLVQQEDMVVLVDAGSTGTPAPVAGVSSRGVETAAQAPYALIDGAGGRAVVAAARDGGVWIGRPGGPTIAVLAAGPDTVHALAIDATQTLLAAAVGDSLQVWPIPLTRAVSRIVPTYDNDRDASSDLLGTGRDAAAIAALVASKVLRPPLSIGLFGGWGSGKSFVLREVRQHLEKLDGEERSDGLLSGIKVIPFNAWQYAEVDLWASLVDAVLREINPPATARAAGPGSGGSAAAAAAATASHAVAAKAGELAEAERTLRTVSHPLRRGALVAGGLALVVGSLAVAVALVAGRWETVVALVSLASTVLAAMAGAVVEFCRTVRPVGELVEAGREVRERLTPLHRLVSARHRAAAAVQVKRTELRIAQEDAARLTELAESPQLGAVLQRLSTVTEYRDQLGLVTRTRERFDEIDKAVSLARATDGDAPPPFERVVILIDDLDRCPPERVVSVLEAVHLLFDFEMFAVLIAVDTRWLEQSLRIRYRRLLGAQDGAEPADYLEKIIQIPLHMLPLDDELVRAMMAGLTGAPVPNDGVRPDPPTATPPALSRADEPAERASRAATTPRPARPPLPVASLTISTAEATAMATVASLVGTTPRTVKRFVNVYRLLKTRAADSAGFDTPRDGFGDHEVVAFLLAVVTGYPTVAGRVLGAIATCSPVTRLADAVTIATDADSPAGNVLRGWLDDHPRYGTAAATRFALWAPEVGRFSFSPVPPR